MKIKKIEQDENLTTAIAGLAVEETLEIPYKRYSSGSLRAMVAQINTKGDCRFVTNTKGLKCGYVTRIK